MGTTNATQETLIEQAKAIMCDTLVNILLSPGLTPAQKVALGTTCAHAHRQALAEGRIADAVAPTYTGAPAVLAKIARIGRDTFQESLAQLGRAGVIDYQGGSECHDSDGKRISPRDYNKARGDYFVSTTTARTMPVDAPICTPVGRTHRQERAVVKTAAERATGRAAIIALAGLKCPHCGAPAVHAKCGKCHKDIKAGDYPDAQADSQADDCLAAAVQAGAKMDPFDGAPDFGPDELADELAQAAAADAGTQAPIAIGKFTANVSNGNFPIAISRAATSQPPTPLPQARPDAGACTISVIPNGNFPFAIDAAGDAGADAGADALTGRQALAYVAAMIGDAPIFTRLCGPKCRRPDCQAPGKIPHYGNWPNRPYTQAQAAAHLARRGNVGAIGGAGGLIYLDIDSDFGAFLAAFPGLADSPRIVRADAPERGKLIVAYTGPAPQSVKRHAADGWAHDIELIGPGAQAVIAGTHQSGAVIALAPGRLHALPAHEIAAIVAAWAGTQAPKPGDAAQDTTTRTPAPRATGRTVTAPRTPAPADVADILRQARSCPDAQLARLAIALWNAQPANQARALAAVEALPHQGAYVALRADDSHPSARWATDGAPYVYDYGTRAHLDYFELVNGGAGKRQAVRQAVMELCRAIDRPLPAGMKP